MNHGRIFLTAEWRWLAMLNWPAPAELLKRYLPRGLELDCWQGSPYVSIVGFMFRDTRLLGWAIPGHRVFPELNLRFYVRERENPEERGVCFVREVVSRPAVSWVARTIYNENYVTCPMCYRLDLHNEQIAAGSSAEYGWKRRGRWNRVSARATGEPLAPLHGTAEEYFTENYWGYTAQRDGGTARYRVMHPPWKIWRTDEATWDCDVRTMYGAEWSETLAEPPESTYLIEGSAVQVFSGTKLAIVETRRHADRV
jgi:uncharacterized protein YqjF (DUF2071 family)